jgi:hypothetical protein
MRGRIQKLWTGRVERELQMVQLSATKCSCIAILWISPVSFAAIILLVASQRVFIVVRVEYVIDSVRKRLVTPSCFAIDSQVSQSVLALSPYRVSSCYNLALHSSNTATKEAHPRRDHG